MKILSWLRADWGGAPAGFRGNARDGYTCQSCGASAEAWLTMVHVPTCARGASEAGEKIARDADPGAAAAAPPGPRAYRMRPYRAEAMWWDGTGLGAQDVSRCFPELLVTVIRAKHPLSRQPKMVLLDLPGPNGKNQQVREACWIVRGQGGGCYFCSGEDFAAMYEPVIEGGTA